MPHWSFCVPKMEWCKKGLCFIHIVSLVSGDLLLSSCWDNQEKKRGSRRRRSLCDSGWSGGYWGHWDGERRKLRGPHWCLSEWVTVSDGRLMRPSNLQFSCRVGICLLVVLWCYQTFSDSMKSASAHNYLWHSLYNASACTYTDAHVDKGKGAPALLPEVTLLAWKHTQAKCTTQNVHNNLLVVLKFSCSKLSVLHPRTWRGYYFVETFVKSTKDYIYLQHQRCRERFERPLSRARCFKNPGVDCEHWSVYYFVSYIQDYLMD